MSTGWETVCEVLDRLPVTLRFNVRIVGTLLLGDGLMMFRSSQRIRMGSHREVALHRMIGRNSHVNVTTFTSICLNCRAGNNRAIVSTFECHVILRPVTLDYLPSRSELSSFRLR